MLGCDCGAETKADADHHLQWCPGGNQGQRESAMEKERQYLLQKSFKLD